jgi:hypothetical protein
MDDEADISGMDVAHDVSSDPDSDELTIDEDILVPIVEIKEDSEDHWNLKKKRTRMKRGLLR